VNTKKSPCRQRSFQFKYSLILLVGFIVLWLLWEVKIIIPKHFLRLNLHGALLILFIIATFRELCKNNLRQDSSLTVWELVKQCTWSILIAQFIFQLIRQFSLVDHTSLERLGYYLASVFGMTIFGCVLAFLLAYHFKVRNTKMLFLFIGIFVLTMFVLQQYIYD
jgi:predicted nucleic acid-binding Zn ribbon protein